MIMIIIRGLQSAPIGGVSMPHETKQVVTVMIMKIIIMMGASISLQLRSRHISDENLPPSHVIFHCISTLPTDMYYAGGGGRHAHVDLHPQKTKHDSTKQQKKAQRERERERQEERDR